MNAGASARPEYFFTALDPGTDLLTWEAPIPSDHISDVWVAAAITRSPEDFADSWRLQPSQASEVARILNWDIAGCDAHYFIEARQPRANFPVEDGLNFDVRGAREDRLTPMRLMDIAIELAMIMIAPIIVGGIVMVVDGSPWPFAALTMVALPIWVWRNFGGPYRAARKVRAYGLALPEIRSALARFRVGARFRVVWLLVNFAGAIAALASLRFGGEVHHLISVVAGGLLILNGLRLASDRAGVRKTAMSYLLIVLIWSGAFAILVPITNALGSDNNILGLPLLGLIWIAVWLTGRVWRTSRGSLADMVKRGLGRPVLFLRSFEDEERIEHLLKDALLPYGPFIGIGKPGELRPDGASRAYFEGDAWRPAVIDMMDDAAVLIVVPGLTPGLDWELQRVTESGRLSKAIFVFGGDDRDQRLARVRRCIGNNAERDQLTAPEPIGVWLAHVGKNRTWVTIKCGGSARGEIQAALDVALYGVLIDLPRRRVDSFAF